MHGSVIHGEASTVLLVSCATFALTVMVPCDPEM